MNGSVAPDKISSRPRDAVFWWRLCLGLTAAGFSLLLIFQPPPWQVLAEAGSGDWSLGQLVYIGTWWGGLGAMAVMGFLFAICPWWARAPHPQANGPLSAAAPRWFWPMVLAAVLAGGAIAAPSLGHSLWDDEHESLVWYVLGRYVRQAPDGHVKLKEHNWRRTIFGYSTPNNHILHNILARSSNTLWRAVAKPKGLQFNETALRMPAFVGGLACIAALAFLLKDFGFPWAGVLAAWFLALQPWFTHHMALARGYTLTMLFAVLVVVFWRRALVSGAWLWWALLAACQFLGIWTYPAVFFLLAAFNIALLLLLARRPRCIAGPPRTMLSRWFCCSAIAGAGLLPLISPLLPQIRAYIHSLNSGLMGWYWVQNFLSFLAGGAAWNNGSTSDPSYQDLQLVATAYGPVIMWALLAGGAIMFVLGFIRFARTNAAAASAAACIVIGPAVHWLSSESKSIVLWEWYLIYVLPFVCMFWAMGLWMLASGVARFSHKRWTGPVVATLAICFYAVATSPVRAWHLAHSRVAYRESVLASRRETEGNRTIVFSTTGAPLGYDPEVFFIEKPVDLAVLMFQADAQNRPLVSNMGQIQTLQSSYRNIFAILDNRTLFPKVERFPGFFSGGDRFVCRYASGSAEGFDFTGILTTQELSYAKSKALIPPEVYFSGFEKRQAAQDAGGYGPAPGVGKEPHEFRK